MSANAVRRNLELKAADPDPSRTLVAALRLGADDRGVAHQRDTYLHGAQGRLKLREAPPAPAELIAYARPDRPQPAVSRFHVVEVADPVPLAAALAEALGVRAVVEKERRLLAWRDVRIHLDRVVGLGSFLELEAAVTGPAGMDEAAARITELREALGISDDRLVARGYADLMSA